MQKQTDAEKKARQAAAVETLRHYFPNGAYVNTTHQRRPKSKYGSQAVRVFAIATGSAPDHTQYVHEITQTAATATGSRTDKYGAIIYPSRTAQDVYEAIRDATGHDLKHNNA